MLPFNQRLGFELELNKRDIFEVVDRQEKKAFLQAAGVYRQTLTDEDVIVAANN